jgi:hypothetical protein
LSDLSSDPDPQPQSSLAEELAAIPYEPLLPVEKWLISVSLILGVTLLAVLSWASTTFFPTAPRPSDTGSHAPASSKALSSTPR